jgi:hypothetical protein
MVIYNFGRGSTKIWFFLSDKVIPDIRLDRNNGVNDTGFIAFAFDMPEGFALIVLPASCGQSLFSVSGALCCEA